MPRKRKSRRRMQNGLAAVHQGAEIVGAAVREIRKLRAFQLRRLLWSPLPGGIYLGGHFQCLFYLSRVSSFFLGL